MVALNEQSLTDRVLSGERVTAEELAVLARLPLEELGVLATARRDLAKRDAYEGRGREIVTYIVDRNINYTNVCNVYCKFCAFYRTEKDDDHYVLSFEQIDRKLDELSVGRRRADPDAGRASSETRIRVVSRSAAITSGSKYPHINIHGFSPPEFQHFAETFRMPLREVIAQFKEAGLGSIPGGGGEILVDRVRQQIAPLEMLVR